MFEKFTEKAINVVSSSQNTAKGMGLKKVSPEILLLALFDEAKGIALKIFKSYDITREKLTDEIKKYVNINLSQPLQLQTLPFDDEYKEILKNHLIWQINQVILQFFTNIYSFPQFQTKIKQC